MPLQNTSSTLQAAGGWGFLAAIAMGLWAVFSPDTYARVPPGFEAALAVGIGVIAGKLQPENNLRRIWEEQQAKAANKKRPAKKK